MWCPECAATSRRFGHYGGCSYGVLDGVDEYLEGIAQAAARRKSFLARRDVQPVPSAVQPVPSAGGVDPADPGVPSAPGIRDGQGRADGRPGQGTGDQDQGNVLFVLEQKVDGQPLGSDDSRPE